MISNFLEKKNTDILEEMLELVKKGMSYIEAFVTVQKLKHIHD